MLLTAGDGNNAGRWQIRQPKQERAFLVGGGVVFVVERHTSSGLADRAADAQLPLGNFRPLYSQIRECRSRHLNA
jgi:hypothetical protein